MKSSHKILFIIILFIASCNEEVVVNNNSQIDTVFIIKEVKKPKETIIFDTIINKKAELIAGKSLNYYENIEQKSFYKNHQKATQKSWYNFDIKNIKPIQIWANKENISISENENSTLFYPFSGPDILYAITLFPNCENYILFGLENPGTIPDFKSVNDSLLEPYFENLTHSIRNLNRFGYFVTIKMKYDFRNGLLDGVVHIILFHLSLADNIVLDVKPFYLDNYGNEIYVNQLSDLSKNIEGIKIWFRNKNSNKIKTLYYLQTDVSNKNLSDNMEFAYFVSKFENKITFMKSASYLLFNNSFDIIKDIILKQSSIILQDDTGLPYKEFAENNFTTQVYGNYNRTINIYKEKFQPDLKTALKNEIRDKELPFRFGYNNRFSETVLILAKQQKADNKTSDEIIYKIQLTMLWDKLDLTDSMFSALPPSIDYYFDEGYYKYTLGLEYSEEACEPLLELAHNAGFTDAFIAAFENGNRIYLPHK